MNTQCQYERDVERWFDGESTDGGRLEAHIQQCPNCQAHVEFLRNAQDAISALPQSPNIADAQLPAFLDGIAEGIHQPRRHYTGLWAMVSGVAAALIAAVAMFSMLTPTEAPIGAQTVIETATTDIDGATIELLGDGNETPTVWLNTPDDGEI